MKSGDSGLNSGPVVAVWTCSFMTPSMRSAWFWRRIKPTSRRYRQVRKQLLLAAADRAALDPVQLARDGADLAGPRAPDRDRRHRADTDADRESHRITP